LKRYIIKHLTIYLAKVIDRKHLVLFFAISLSLISIGCQDNSELDFIARANIIPAPNELVVGDGYFKIPRDLMIINAPENFKSATTLLHKYLGSLGAVGFSSSRPEETASFIFKQNNSITNEGYILTISEENISISASTPTGAFYAVQSLRQLLPLAIENTENAFIENIKIPTLIIKDEPRFKYRGMHLDVSRHFFPVEFIKEYIDHLAMLKMNTFHWHLTDDQGWRIEIKQYPELTTKGAYREETLIGHYNDTPQLFDGKRYGGFYTQEEVKEIVSYATARHVTVIPEIEMPGHAQAAIHAYPELGCTGEQIPVATQWGVFSTIFCPKEETFTFLKNVLDEVIPLFPGEYIHIGGDEAPKEQWKKCNHCQKLIADKGLKDQHGLQSYFIKEIETYINGKGKKMIGWDEILEGGLAPNATVMSWRGTQGAVDAANQGHDVILTPTSHAYFDYYQATYEDEPTAIGGYLPLKKVYSFNPIPKKLQGTKAAKHVLGAQGNIWTEYLSTEDQVEYMAFPRMLAMAEVAWSGPTQNLEEDYTNFLIRLEPFLERLDALDINYANHLYDLEGSVVKTESEVFYQLTTPTNGKVIKYTINNGDEQLYHQPIKISEDAIINGHVYKDELAVGRKFTNTIRYHKAIKAKVEINVEPHPSYNAGGKQSLINGVTGSNTRFGDKEWLGFWGDDLEITITFPEPTKMSKISTRFYNANGQWLYAPIKWEALIILESDAVLSNKQMINSDEQLVFAEIKLDTKTYLTKQLILKIPSYGTIPDGLQGAGNKAWTFIDEIIIE
jgi:hexosaminidase